MPYHSIGNNKVRMGEWGGAPYKSRQRTVNEGRLPTRLHWIVRKEGSISRKEGTNGRKPQAPSNSMANEMPLLVLKAMAPPTPTII